MTDRIALGLGLLIVLAIGLDITVNDGAALLFLMRKFADLLEYLSFWR
ncbi:hypothetical protein [Szabonella alba]|uniref:Uncharacterized protein n=1 Tax=Szabonella alba TaxID=2804194 RepID=A0A8K0Y161_9RHOB|nr:hypothetical protein [Szabonella alba]MBL4917823.1 hypothetical protein [Szabonella alba]